ncbi:glutamate receptor ionotropic, kainate 4 [Procambarus clarkii]|uniref:glutamate receptor ionotropic, kainate 4 n=1 Tax=Procambarus clarkii TaxID=6728 RepID=UPI001E6727D5|nr:glutamate receptor ionotropic, kainate 4-like [Procambarus clarkii]
MGRSTLLCVLLCWTLLCECQSDRSQASTSRCWTTVHDEDPPPASAPEDFAMMARYVVEFAKLINVNEIYFCVTQESGLHERTLKHIFASTLTRHMIFFSPCNIGAMWASVQALDAGSFPENTIPRFLRPAALHITSRTGLATTLSSLWHKDVGYHLGTYHLVMGVHLPHCQVQLKAIARWFQASYNVSSKTVVTEEVFLFGDEKESLHVPVTSWGPQKKGHTITVLQQPTLGPQDFQGHVINVISMEYAPQMMKSAPCTEESACPQNRLVGVTLGNSAKAVNETAYYEGYLIDILLTLATALNFRVNLSILHPDDAVVGVDTGDGNYSGLVGALQSLKADVALSGFSMTRERYQVMDFSVPVVYSSVALYIWRNSTLLTIGWDTFVLSFHWGTWLAVVLLLAIMSLSFSIIVWYQSDEDPHFRNGCNVFFMLFSCLVQQGSWILPVTGRAQAVLWMFWFSSLVLYASYTARLTSFLTVSSIRLPFYSLEQAVNTPGWKIGLLRGTSTSEELERSQEDYLQKIHNEIKQNPSLLFSTDMEGINRIFTQPQYAILSDRIIMDYLLKGNCSVIEVPGSYLGGYWHLGFRKRLPYASIINQELIKMSSGGILDRLHQRWWGKPIPCEAPSPYTELGFSNILTAFILLIAGGILSILLLMLELCYKPRSGQALMSSNAIPSTLKTKISD